MGRVALITGITGQDGSYLAELLLKKGYDVFGVVRRLSRPNLGNIEHIADRLTLLDADLLDQGSLNAAVKESEPDEVYNLAAQTFAATSFVQPVLTGEVTGLGAIRVLEAVKSLAPDARVYQASSSEMFGQTTIEPQDENTPFHPASPYGVAKVYAHNACVSYRQAYDMFVATGILYNHEGPGRRGMEFVTRKISHNVARILLGLADSFALGTLEAKRDWGYAPEYVDLMWRILQHDEPDDFIGATGRSYSVRDFLVAAFREVGIADWEEHVTYDKRFVRPTEIINLRGDATKAWMALHWKASTKFEDLVHLMVEADLALLGD